MHWYFITNSTTYEINTPKAEILLAQKKLFILQSTLITIFGRNIINTFVFSELHNHDH